MPNVTRRALLGSVAIGAAAGALRPAAAATPTDSTVQTIPLYPGDIPDALEAPDEEATRDPKEAWIFRQNISRPMLSVYLPKQRDAKRAAVIICPGGSYRGLSIDKEGHAVARAFNAFGVASIVLKYRTPSPRHMRHTWIGPLQDAQQAMSVVRAKADDWNIARERVGIVGFSAGGHLAASASTLFHEPVLSAHTRETVRPSFSVLAYPVISMSDELAHAVSREQLLGSAPSAELLERYSAERAITHATPPAFLMHAADDASVLVGNSLRYFESLNARQISAQLLVYPHGGHGFGLVNPTTPDRWIDRVQAWMAGEGWLHSSSTT